jgi:subtilisin family serine protease
MNRASKRNSRAIRAALLVALIACSPFLAASSCNQSQHDPPGDGVLIVMIQTPSLAGTPLATLGELDAVSSRVDVVYRSDCKNPSTESVTTVSTDAITIHFVAGSSTAPRLVARLNVPAGCVEQVRFIMQSMSAVLSGKTLAVKMPSGKQTGVKMVPAAGAPPFPVGLNQTTTILADYDPNQKLVINKGQGAIEKPVVEAHVIPNESGEAATGFINDEVVVTFDPAASQGDIAAALGFCLYFKSGTETLHNYYTFKLFSSADLYDAIACLQGKPGVVAALPNTLLALNGPNPFSGTPNDPLYQQSPPTGYDALNLQTIKAPQAWTVTTGSDNVVVAVVDNGFDMLHADLMDNIWINPGEIPKYVQQAVTERPITFRVLNLAKYANDTKICNRANSPPDNICDPLDLADGKGTVGYGWQDGKDDDGDGYADDFFGWNFQANNNLPEPNPNAKFPFHGTAVAGVMAGIGNNGVASAGVAWHARVMLLEGQLLTSTNPSLPVTDLLKRDSVVDALHYAKAKKAQIINLSTSAPLFRQDADTYPDCQGIHELSATKFKEGVQALAKEWQTEVADAGDGLVTLGLTDCAGFKEDEPGLFDYPNFTAPRPDAGVSYTDPALISVTGVDATQSGSLGPPVAACLPVGGQSVLIGAPGTAFTILDAQPYPPVGLNTATTDCAGDQPATCPIACSGTSLAAPEVAGAGILVLANNPALTPLDVKARLLDTATNDLGVNTEIQGNRLLDVAAAVGP